MASAIVILCGRLAPLSSVCMYLSPIPTIRQVVRTGMVGDLPLLPYSSMAASCFVWIVYGIAVRQPMIWLTNFVELILAVYYFIEFTNYAPKEAPTFPGRVYDHIYGIIAIWCTAILLALFSFTSCIGQLTVIMTILTFASPLAAVRAVLEKQSSQAIPLPFTLAAFGNCVLWTVVGVWKLNDAYVYIPAVLGLGLALLQVGLKLYYHSGDRDDNPRYMMRAITATADATMPHPVLQKVREVVNYGNAPFHYHADHANSLHLNLVTNDHHRDDMLLPSSSANDVSDAESPPLLPSPEALARRTSSSATTHKK